MLTKNEINDLESGALFKKENLIGKGLCGSIYRINDKYVVKKITSIIPIKFFDKKIFRNELEATVILSSFNVSPKVVYHSKPKEKNRYFVMEKWITHFAIC